MEILITAHGHKNIMAQHKTTIEITTDPRLSPSGDCIVAVGCDKGFLDLAPHVKETMRRGKMTLTFECAGHTWSISGRGDPALRMEHPTDMVIRKSTYCCPRTLMIGADKAAYDMPRDMVQALAVPGAVISIRLHVTHLQDSTHAHQSTRSENPQGSAQDGARA